MNKYHFSNAERFAIWKHHGQHCYWCGEPLRLQETTVDHVIPESLLSKPDEFARVKHLFSLHADFAINSYSNWLPAHDRCNRGKSAKVFAPVPMLVAVLEKLSREAESVQAIATRVENNRKVDTLLGKLLAAVENSTISKEEILAALADPELTGNQDAKLLEHEFYLHVDGERWQVISVNEGLAVVSNGQVAGMTPVTRAPDITWQCPSCTAYGPWNGVTCMNCGRMSSPYE